MGLSEIGLKTVFQNKYSVLATAALICIPIYSWKSFYEAWKKWKHEYEHKVLFEKRHDCVVTYQANKGMSGWPPHLERHNTDRSKVFEEFYEPIIYFIQTAEDSLDVSSMIINIKLIYSELLKAFKRGVKIRIITNFQHSDSSKDDIYKLTNEGIPFQFFVTPSSTMDSIMHNKYIVKDYKGNGGYVCFGSMNFTANAVLNNYESLIFSSNPYVVGAFKDNFEECWHNIKSDNEGLINKTVLMDAQFI